MPQCCTMLDTAIQRHPEAHYGKIQKCSQIKYFGYLLDVPKI